MQDSPEYLARKRLFDNLLTIYGRKPVLEALQDSGGEPVRLHLSRKNRPAEILDRIFELAEKRGAEIREHDAASLSRISKNAKQDQGVALDIRSGAHASLEKFLQTAIAPWRLIALDGITNPQNLGLIIRSVAASPANGLLLCRDSSPALSPLVIKASAGTVFRAPLVRAESLRSALKDLRAAGAEILVMDANAKHTLNDRPASGKPQIFVLGNETSGVSDACRALATDSVRIPMARGVESLNVAATATLVAFSS